MAMDYKTSQMDIATRYASVELMKKYVKGTMRPEVLGGLGRFQAHFHWKRSKRWKSLCCCPEQTDAVQR